jgi:hypothetical protein
MAISEYKYPSPEQRLHFLEHGWVRIEQGIPDEHVRAYRDNIWIRLGYHPNNKETWIKEKVHTPRHRQMPTKEFAPKAWGAICEPKLLCLGAGA